LEAVVIYKVKRIFLILRVLVKAFGSLFKILEIEKKS
jgi:hypothetical protein